MAASTQQPVDDRPALGSRWYIGGAHWEAIAHTTRDDEPAVQFRSIRDPRRTMTWIWRLAGRHALPSGTES